MRHTRIYQASPIIAGEMLTLDAGASQHVLRVLRLKVGDKLSIFNGTIEHHAELMPAKGTQAVVFIQTQRTSSSPSPLKTEIAFAATRSDTLDWIVQKATEMGINTLRPIYTAHSGAHLSSERAQKRQIHLEKVAISACEQCGRVDVPEIIAIESLESLIEREHKNATIYLLDPRGTQSLPNILTTKAPHSVLIISGPEGGFSESEIEYARSRGTHIAQLGPRILRAETAPLAALALVQAHWGDWR